jgi:hypothetical protein
VGQVEVTIPLGYVVTLDAGIAYELGKPLAMDNNNNNQLETTYSLNGIMSKTVTTTAAALTKQASDLVSTSTIMASTSSSQKEEDVMLVRLVALTGTLMVGATAVSMLSHHLTVNVFWV